MTVGTIEKINYQRVEKAIEYLGTHFRHQPDLYEVAEEVHISSFHFQRIFTEWAGISPKRFLQFLTVNFLKDRLQETKNIMEAAESAGLSSQSRVYDLFTALEGVTPQEYKLKGKGLRIDYAFGETPFGMCLTGITDRGICWFSFLGGSENEQTALDAMKEHWYNSVCFENAGLVAPIVKNIFAKEKLSERLHLFVKGTNFQIKVWEALLKIPVGGVTTYQTIAASVDNPKAVQAVGSAVGSNHIAYLIPCHRVIRKDGILGEYRWNATRKKGMIGYEIAQTI